MSNTKLPAVLFYGERVLFKPAERVTRPLTAEEEARLAQQRADLHSQVTPEALDKLAKKFAKPEPQRASQDQSSLVNNGWEKVVLEGSVNWDKQNLRFDQQRTGGKRKNESGKKNR